MARSGPIPVYVINLDRSPQRLAHMTAQLSDLGIAFERLPAVDGRVLDPAYVAKFAPLAASQIGCFLSHKLAWQRIAWGDAPCGIVLEDDIHIAPALAPFVRAANWVPADAGIVKLETMLTRVSIDATALPGPGSSKLARLRSLHPGTAAFLLSRQVAAALLQAFPDPVLAADGAIFGAKALQLTAIYQADPAPCIQDRVRPAEQQDARLAPVIDANPLHEPLPAKLAREAQRLLEQVGGAAAEALGLRPRRKRCVVPFATGGAAADTPRLRVVSTRLEPAE